MFLVFLPLSSFPFLVAWEVEVLLGEGQTGDICSNGRHTLSGQ